MTEFKQDEETTPVLFRMPRNVKLHGNDCDAIMPTIPGTNDAATMTCYAHIGQHGSCHQNWIQSTRPATPEEYADLKAELESAPYGYRFKVYRRIQPWMRDERIKQLRHTAA